jgi:hypothetical protein
MLTGIEIIIQGRSSNARLDVLEKFVSKISNDDRQHFPAGIQVGSPIFLFLFDVQLSLFLESILLGLLSLFGSEAFRTWAANVIGVPVRLTFHVHDVGEQRLHVA